MFFVPGNRELQIKTTLISHQRCMVLNTPSNVILCPQVTGETINPKPQNPHKTVGTLGKQETNRVHK